jgi:hypothetical protein
MSKSLDILMAGIIAGLVAYTTSQLGVGGTVIGAVLGSMLYQFVTHFVKEPVGKVKTQKIEREIFYIFPLVIILAIELIYLLAQIYSRPDQIIFTLEAATGNNLFKFMGIGLIIMGIYPIIQPKRINKLYGYILLVVGVIKLLVGFVDVNTPFVQLYAPLYFQINEVVSLAVIAAISFVVIAIGRESIQLYHEKEAEEEEKDIRLEETKDK